MSCMLLVRSILEHSVSCILLVVCVQQTKVHSGTNHASFVQTALVFFLLTISLPGKAFKFMLTLYWKCYIDEVGELEDGKAWKHTSVRWKPARLDFLYGAPSTLFQGKQCHIKGQKESYSTEQRWSTDLSTYEEPFDTSKANR